MPTKTRSHGIRHYGITPVQFRYERRNRTVTTFNGTPTPAYDRRQGSSETITYQTGNDGTFRPCKHTKVRYEMIVEPSSVRFLTLRPTTSQTQIASNESFGMVQSCHRQFYSNFTNGVGSVGPPDSFDWDAYASTALRQMLPSFSSGNSLLNSLWELKDLKRVGVSILALINNWRQFRGRVHPQDVKDNLYDLGDSLLGLPKRLRGKPRSKWTLRDYSSVYLNYNFGWRSLYRDIVSLVEELDGFRDRLARIMSQADKPITKYWRTEIPGSAIGRETYMAQTAQSLFGGWTGDSRHMCWARVIKEATNGIQYSATLRCKYKVPAILRGAEGRLKAHLDHLGVSGNPAILWNAIPWSFLIDWFVDVGDFLNGLRVDNMPLQTEITDFCHSMKAGRGIRYELNNYNQFYSTNSAYTQEFGGWYLVDWASVTVYERRTGLPGFYGALVATGLDPREFLLSGALIGSRR